MAEKERLDARAARRTALPQECFGLAQRVTISGTTRVLVEGLRALEEYADDKISASVRGGRVVIRGEALRLDAMDGTELIVSGRIWGVELE